MLSAELGLSASTLLLTLGQVSPGQEGSGASHLFHSVLRVPTHGVLIPGRAAEGQRGAGKEPFCASQQSKHFQAAAIHFFTLGTLNGEFP